MTLSLCVAEEEDPQQPPPEEAENGGEDGDEGEFGEDSEQAAGQLGGDITDISNSAAVKYLEKLVQTGQLTEPRCHGTPIDAPDAA